MKKNNSFHTRRPLGVLAAIVFCLPVSVQPALAEKNATYIKVFEWSASEGNAVQTVACNSYDDHALLSETGDPLPGMTITQNDMILGISVLCPKYEMHLDPVVHTDGNEWDWWEITDAEDGHLDFISAQVSCVENLDGVFGETFTPSRVVLQCLDHDAIIANGRSSNQ